MIAQIADGLTEGSKDLTAFTASLPFAFKQASTRSMLAYHQLIISYETMKDSLHTEQVTVSPFTATLSNSVLQYGQPWIVFGAGPVPVLLEFS